MSGGDKVTIIWALVAVLCLMAELLNRKCAYIWFSLSSALSCLCSIVIHNYILSFSLFLFGGFILLVIFRDYTMDKIYNYFNKKLVDKKGVVVKQIDKKHIGRVKIGNKRYKAKSNRPINKNKKIKVTGYNNHIVEVVEDKK